MANIPSSVKVNVRGAGASGKAPWKTAYMKQGRKDIGRPFYLGLVGGQAQEGDSLSKAGGYHAAETKASTTKLQDWSLSRPEPAWHHCPFPAFPTDSNCTQEPIFLPHSAGDLHFSLQADQTNQGHSIPFANFWCQSGVCLKSANKKLGNSVGST